jgi:hypothetical protein
MSKGLTFSVKAVVVFVLGLVVLLAAFAIANSQIETLLGFAGSRSSESGTLIPDLG